ncbi:ATP-binding protein [Qipengyuania flava]|nr:ATP-binding protein [Qipengyuania flava]
MANMISTQYGSNKNAPSAGSKFEIAGYGKIKNAEVELAPLTVFVGRNDSGKSYIAYVMWAIWSGYFGLQNTAENQIEAPKWFRDAVDNARSNPAVPVEINAKRISRHYNTWITKNKSSLVRGLISFDGAEIDKLRFDFSGSLYLWARKKPPKWVSESDFVDWSVEPWAFTWSDQYENPDEMSGMVGSTHGQHPSNILYRSAIEKLIHNDITAIWGHATYLPAARTGLVLAIKELAASSISNYGIAGNVSRTSGGQFTAPMRNFLRSLIGLSEHRSGHRYGEVVEFLRSNVFKGQLEIDGKGAPEFTYVTEDKSARLPMHAVSSMISEMTPIVALLEHSYIGNGLVIEEPEAHLHLQAQRVMARAIIRLVNAGLKVTVTTHSDTFLQQLNIACRAEELKNDIDYVKVLGLEESDIISRSQVKVYEFIEEGDKTLVKEASYSDDGGFVVSSINDTLYDIAEDVIALESVSDT